MQLSPLSSLNPFGAPTLDGLDVTNAEPGKRIGGDSRRQHVRFYKKREMVLQREKDGSVRPLEVEREWVFIKTPGDTNETDTRAEEYHKRDHLRAYRAFREGRTGPIGTALAEASFVAPHVATELEMQGVYTIEQLADAGDALCGVIPDGFLIRDFARAMCATQEQNKSLQVVTALKGQLEEERRARENMERQIEALRNLVANTQIATEAVNGIAESVEVKPRRGRPKKTEKVEIVES